MALQQQLSVVGWIAIVLLVVEAKDYEPLKARPDQDPRCHMPKVISCQTSPYQQSNYSLVGWYFFAAFKSCHPLYSEGGVHHCKHNEDLPRTRDECEDVCGEPCKMDNGTAGICMFDKYCKRAPHEHVRNTRPCKAYEVSCCLRRSAPAIKHIDQPTTITRKTTNEMSAGGHNIQSPEDGYPSLTSRRNNIHAPKTAAFGAFKN